MYRPLTKIKAVLSNLSLSRKSIIPTEYSSFAFQLVLELVFFQDKMIYIVKLKIIRRKKIPNDLHTFLSQVVTRN